MAAAVSGSSTEEKARVLPPLLDDDDIALVVAFGTAATPGDETRNRCVVIGTNVFLHDPKVQDSSSHWEVPKPDELVGSALSAKAFDGIIELPRAGDAVPALGLTPPNNPSKPQLLAAFQNVALADVNVTNYLDYKVADPEVVAAYVASGGTFPVGSLETTHGVIRECTPDNVPFMFVSGITDRVGHFDEEVGTAVYQQNFVAAHNAGVAVAAMMPALLNFLAPSLRPS